MVVHCTKSLDLRDRIYPNTLKIQHHRKYYSHLYNTVFQGNHIVPKPGLSFCSHFTSIPFLFVFVFVQSTLNPRFKTFLNLHCSSTPTRILFPPDKQSILNYQFYVEETHEEIRLGVMLIYRDLTHFT